MKVPRARGQLAQPRRHIDEAPRDQVGAAVLGLPLARHREQAQVQERLLHTCHWANRSRVRVATPVDHAEFGDRLTMGFAGPTA